jgi:uncharacterized membrane protein
MRLLAAVSATQLVLGLSGLAKALRSRGSFDIGVLRGSPATIDRDQWVTGTSLSAPGLMLVLQAVSTVGLFTSHRPAAARSLLVLGVIMSLGYPAEKDVRRAWRHREMPNAALTAAAEVLAMMMVVLAHAAAPRAVTS